MIILKQGDITREAVDAIVNAANTQLKGGGGVDGAIHGAAGPSVMEECRKIGSCPTGTAVMTRAGELQAQVILHTAGPVWNGGKNREAELLHSCYEACFRLALQHDCKTIAFPAISTGVYGYPKPEAAQIAIKAALIHEKSFDEVRFVCFSENDLTVYQNTYQKLT